MTKTKTNKTKMTPFGKYLDSQRAHTRLSEGEIEALAYYNDHQFGQPTQLGQEYIARALAELRAIRKAGVLVDVTPYLPPAIELAHLAECKPPSVVDHVEDSEPRDHGLGILEQNSYTTISESTCVADCPVFRKQQLDEWKANDGKWTLSTSEEHWSSIGDYCYDTEAEAVRAGGRYGEDQGIEDGRLFWVGRIDHVTASELADVFNADDMLDRMSSHLYDNFSDEVDYDLHVTTAEEGDLENRVRPIIERWMLDHHITPQVCRIAHVTSHIWRQCEAEDSMRGDPSNHPRCTLHANHDGREHVFE